MEYNFSAIERQWKQYWKERNTYKVSNNSDKPKFYVLDMFPYPSGAGLHVGHPLGYIASDILARYKRLQGYNVLHPMGYDAFGLPAEQYALETGQHPAVTTEQNIARYREQLDNIGFCFDWEREVRTSDPKYYKWTQWIFLQLFHSWYDRQAQQAKPLSGLVALFEQEGNAAHPCPGDDGIRFSAAEWIAKTGLEKREVLMQYRLAYLDYAEVWWCEPLGTVLANDEVVNGVSERGGYPVVKKKLKQWFLRITEFADRLLDGLNNLEWSDAMKEMQRNWIGKSRGAEVNFRIAAPTHSDDTTREVPSAGGDLGEAVKVFTTRPDTIFGVDFMVLAPEHELVDVITAPAQQEAVAEYKQYVQSRSERERMTEVKQVTGCFTGAYALHPFSGRKLPVYISEYVLAGYGTGAIMAVPSGDERDHAFAKHFDIPVTNIFGALYNGETAYSEKSGVLENSDFLNGMDIAAATDAAIRAIEAQGIGKAKINYKLRDAGFGRQRYWGEPFPIVYVGDVPYAIDEPELELKEEKERNLPVELPYVGSYKPGPDGQGPLANIADWVQTSAGLRETSTMPGYAGSSWYFLRYMDPHNEETFADRKATDYWRQVDVYIGGTEHAVGHLLYSRMWTKALHDLGHISFDEPFKMLVNQGMIQGKGSFIYVAKVKSNALPANKLYGVIPLSADKDYTYYLSADALGKDYPDFEREFYPIRVPLNCVNDEGYLDIDKWLLESSNSLDQNVVFINRKWAQSINENWVKSLDNKETHDRNEFKKSTIPDILFLKVHQEVEKMSKRWLNVVNPDDVVEKYGADTFRMYEMFLGPLDVSKPWDTKGIEGVHRFLKKMWRLYADEHQGWVVTDEAATEAELRILHKTIKKVGEDIERFSFNTAVSQFMICVNELSSLNCRKASVLKDLAVVIAPFAPHLAEELWQHCFREQSSVTGAPWPKYEEQYVKDSSKKYPVAVNGKTRTELEFPLDAAQSTIEKEVLADPIILKWLDGKSPKKVIFVQGKMINIVI